MIRSQGHKGGAPDGVSALLRGGDTSALFVRTQGGVCHPQVRKRNPPGAQPCWHPDIGLVVSRTVRNKPVLSEPPSLWYFVRAAEQKQA